MWLISSGHQEDSPRVTPCTKQLYKVPTCKDLPTCKIRGSKLGEKKKSRAPKHKVLSCSALVLGRDDRWKAQKMRLFPHLSAEQTRQNPESRQNLIPLISGPTSEARKQPDKPHLPRPDPTPPSPKAKGKQGCTPLTADSKQEAGLCSALRAWPESVNTRQTRAERRRRDYGEDLRHLGIDPSVPRFDLAPLSV